MAIGKLLPRTTLSLFRCAPRVAVRPEIRCRKAGHLCGLGKRRSDLKIFEALSLRRYHSRKRNVKPVLMELSIIRFPANCLPRKSHFLLNGNLRNNLGFWRLQPEPAGAALAERLF